MGSKGLLSKPIINKRILTNAQRCGVGYARNIKYIFYEI
jgi:hypothetical protein